MRVLVTGANEFLGLNVVQALCTAGHEVDAYTQPATNVSLLASMPVHLHTGDIADRQALTRLMHSAKFVVHCACSSLVGESLDYERTLRAEVEGTRVVVSAAIETGVRRLVHTSSTATIGADDDPLRQWNEDSRLSGFRADDRFGRAKAEAEGIVRAAIVQGLDTITLNPGEIIGPWDHEGRGFGRVLLAVAAGKGVLVPLGTGSFGSATEIARAHVAALTQGSIGARYILAGTDTTYADLVGTMRQIVGAGLFPMGGGLPDGPPPSVVESNRETGDGETLDPYRTQVLAGHFRFDSSRAVRDLGYRVVPLAAMLQEAYDWYRANGFISVRAPP